MQFDSPQSVRAGNLNRDRRSEHAAAFLASELLNLPQRWRIFCITSGICETSEAGFC